MLTTLHLGNFKAFGATQRIPIKPITLVFGANSSGKSSIIHSLLLLHEANSGSDFAMPKDEWGNRSYKVTSPSLDIYQPRIAGDLVDLGGFRSYVHGRNTDLRTKLEIEVDLTNEAIKEAIELAIIDSPFSDYKRLSVRLEIGSSLARKQHLWPAGYDETKGEGIWKLEEPTPEELSYRPAVQVFEILVDGSLLLRFERTRRFAADLVFWAESHPLLKSGNEVVSMEGGPADHFEAICSFLPETIFGKGGGLAYDFEGRGLVSVRKLIRTARLCIDESCSKITYLGGLRVLPPRQLMSARRQDPNWESGGMSAWEQLIDEPALLDLVNVWLSDRKRLNTPFRLEVRDLFPLQQLRRQIISASQETKDSIKLEDLNRVFDAATRVAVPDLALIDQRTGVSVSHRDVGLGISQILPVLVHCYAKEREILAIEQPEIHLHPSLQAELTDVFIQSALGEQRNTFLLETHSEHLILRLLRRVRETTDGRLPAGMPPVRPEDVSVLYVQPGENGAEVIEMPVTPDGDFARPWPGGFFAERLEELP